MEWNGVDLEDLFVMGIQVKQSVPPASEKEDQKVGAGGQGK